MRSYDFFEQVFACDVGVVATQIAVVERPPSLRGAIEPLGMPQHVGSMEAPGSPRVKVDWAMLSALTAGFGLGSDLDEWTDRTDEALRLGDEVSQ
ncbi:hypothetical protein [Nocardioides sp.]|uniref:hypothetical protein n=1 Tax=Nocardioides sp. TaxID=35761 RepID=UPI00199EBFF4|nr:hypothetical protein [Nocardioides sp.]MBC7275025.1 hypothetical protein [Nocardioides sp.]